jgi:hypothetical protein
MVIEGLGQPHEEQDRGDGSQERNQSLFQRHSDALPIDTNPIMAPRIAARST